MAKKGKRFKAILEKIDKEKEYSLKEAIDLTKECATAKFDESVEIEPDFAPSQNQTLDEPDS